jgi:hypothetical protein
MYAEKEKAIDNKSRAVANSVVQKKSNVKQGYGFIDNRPEVVAQGKFQREIAVNQRIIQFSWPRTLNAQFAEQLVREVMIEKGIEYSNEIGQPYIDRVMYDDEDHTTLTGWGSRDAILIYLRNVITEEAEEAEEVEYNQVTGTYGTIPADMVRTLVEDWGCNEDTLQTALDRITSQLGRWNYVRRLGSTSSELKLTGALRYADQRVFAGANQVFDTIGNALH